MSSTPITVVIDPDGDVSVLGDSTQVAVIIDRRRIPDWSLHTNGFLSPSDVDALDGWSGTIPDSEAIRINVIRVRDVPTILEIAEARVRALDVDPAQPTLPGL